MNFERFTTFWHFSGQQKDICVHCTLVVLQTGHYIEHEWKMSSWTLVLFFLTVVSPFSSHTLPLGAWKTILTLKGVVQSSSVHVLITSKVEAPSAMDISNEDVQLLRLDLTKLVDTGKILRQQPVMHLLWSCVGFSLMLKGILKSVGSLVDKLWTCLEYESIHSGQKIWHWLIPTDLAIEEEAARIFLHPHYLEIL